MIIDHAEVTATTDEDPGPSLPVSTGGLIAAKVKALADMAELPRDKTATIETRGGGSYGYKYTDLASVFSYVRPILAAHGLAVTTDQETSPDYRYVRVRARLDHVSGETEFGSWLAMPNGGDPQGTGSSLTYAKRYQVLSHLGLATEDDDAAKAVKQVNQATERETLGRTRDEAKARELLNEIPPDQVKLVRKAFKEEFGCTLAQLAQERHGDALSFIRDAIADLAGPPPQAEGAADEPG